MSSGDVAIPLAEIGSDEPILTPVQRQRVEALQIARKVLENKAGLFAGSKPAGDDLSSFGHTLTYVADWILYDPVKAPDGSTEPGTISDQTQRDAENAAYFNSGWNAHRIEVLSMAEISGNEAAVTWSADHPAGYRPAVKEAVSVPTFETPEHSI